MIFLVDLLMAKIIQLSFDGYNNIITAVGSNYSIWYANQSIYTNPNWVQIPGSLNLISYSNGKAYGCDINNKIYYLINCLKKYFKRLRKGNFSIFPVNGL